VRHAIRPEKIDITKEKPAGLPDDFAILHGTVSESVYSGFQSQFYVETANKVQFKVYQQHESYIERGPAIRWTDKVYINWDADDGYIVELI
jgi:ABC-type Fe3+/spermidine/putrescine transport system ATPase subunit